MNMEPIGEERKPWVSASLFLFSQHQRLSVSKFKQGSYIELVYELDDNGKGRWFCLGWEEGVYGEYEGIDESGGKLEF